MRILFMGTPDFAVASLKRLVADGHDICGLCRPICVGRRAISVPAWRRTRTWTV